MCRLRTTQLLLRPSSSKSDWIRSTSSKLSLGQMLSVVRNSVGHASIRPRGVAGQLWLRINSRIYQSLDDPRSSSRIRWRTNFPIRPTTMLVRALASVRSPCRSGLSVCSTFCGSWQVADLYILRAA